MNMIAIDGEKAVISFDPDIQIFRGEFIGSKRGADFYADNGAGLIEEGRRSLVAFFDLCREKGIEPRRHFSDRFNLRLDPAVHEAASAAASATGVSLNEWATGAIREAAINAN